MPALAIWLLELIVILIAVVAVAGVVWYFVGKAGFEAPIAGLVNLGIVVVALVALFLLLVLLGVPPLK